MPFIKKVSLIATFLMFNLSGIGNVEAAALGVDCEISRGTGILNRSRIIVRGGDLIGKYYVRVISGGIIKQSTSKVADNKGMVNFIFDSTPKAGITAIPATFIKKATVVGVLRKALTNARIGALRATCAIVR